MATVFQAPSPGTTFTASVPCDGCTACCTHDLIMLYPENGDQIGRYKTFSVRNPLTGEMGEALTKGPDGRCVYLGAKGCTIYDDRPVLCRTFDCREVFRKLQHIPRPERRRMARTRMLSMDIYNAGRTRAATLGSD